MLTVTLFGQADATWNGASIDLLRRQTRALFYRLAVQPDSISREQLCFLFWPDIADATARRNLTRLLTHLRRALPMPDILVTTPDAVSLHAGIVVCDVVAFERHLRQADRQTDVQLLKQAVDLYRGSFLSGFSFPDCAEYDNWLADKRRAFERQYLHALTTLIDHAAAQQEHRTAIDYAHRYLEHDELDETVHRRLIELYAAAGDRVNAERQFEACTTILERELGVAPLPETRAAYEATLTEHPLPAPHPVPPLAWATLPGLDLPIVGRNDALAGLESCYHKAAAGSGSVVLISGEAGIGKSRLLQEFATRWETVALVLAGAGQPGEQALPYLPVTQILRRGIHLSRGVLRVDPIWLAEASLLLPELRTLYPNLPAPLQTDAQQARTRLFESLTQITLALTQLGRPLLLCFDDLHWTDSATLDWIAYLAQSIRHRRILLIGTYRQEEPDFVAPLLHRLLRQGALSEVVLKGLDANDVHQLLDHADGFAQNGDALARQLALVTGGNAFFLTEMVRVLQTTDITSSKLDHLDNLPVPKTVTEAVSARLKRLSPLAQQVLEAASVLRLPFSYPLVQETAGRTAMEAVDGLDELVDNAVLRGEGEDFYFHHDILRLVVYQSLSPWRRRLLHHRAGEVMEAYQSENIAAIAWHFEQGAADLNKAIHYLQRAGNTAMQLFAYHEVIDYFTRAVKLLSTLPATRERNETELTLRSSLLRALPVAKGFASAEVTPHLNRTVALCGELEDRNRLCLSLHSLWAHHFNRAEHEDALMYARHLLSVANEMEVPALLFEACRTVEESLSVLGRLDRPSMPYTLDGHPMDGFTQEPLYTFIRGKHLDYLCQAGRILWLRGYPDQGLRQVQAALTLAEAVGSPFAIAASLGYVVLVHHFRREMATSELPLQRLLKLVDEHRYSFLDAPARVCLGWVQSASGQHAEAVAQIQSAIADWRQSGAGYLLPYMLGLLARAWAASGDGVQGLHTLATAFAQVEQTQERFWEPELFRLKGTLLQRSAHSHQEIESCFHRAIVSAQEQGLRSLELRATVNLARFWQVQGRRQEACQRLSEIYGWFTEGFGTPDLKEARTLLESL